MGIFAHNERALAMLGEVFPDSDDGRVHLAFHVAGVVVAAVMENALVVNQARVVQPVEKLGEVAGEQILQRIETPDAPAFEQLLTSAYKPCGA